MSVFLGPAPAMLHHPSSAAAREHRTSFPSQVLGSGCFWHGGCCHCLAGGAQLLPETAGAAAGSLHQKRKRPNSCPTEPFSYQSGAFEAGHRGLPKCCLKDLALTLLLRGAAVALLSCLKSTWTFLFAHTKANAKLCMQWWSLAFYLYLLTNFSELVKQLELNRKKAQITSLVCLSKFSVYSRVKKE